MAPGQILPLPECRGRLVEFLYRMVQDIRAAEEMAQEALMRTDSRNPAQLFRAAYDLADGGGAPGAAAGGLRAAVAALPKEARAAVILHKYHGWDSGDIGRVLRATPSSVNGTLLRAYRFLHTALTPP